MSKHLKKDKFGRTWLLPQNELCPKCGQPDSCGDCNYKRLSSKQVRILNGFELQAACQTIVGDEIMLED